MHFSFCQFYFAFCQFYLAFCQMYFAFCKSIQCMEYSQMKMLLYFKLINHNWQIQITNDYYKKDYYNYNALFLPLQLYLVLAKITHLSVKTTLWTGKNVVKCHLNYYSTWFIFTPVASYNRFDIYLAAYYQFYLHSHR